MKHCKSCGRPLPLEAYSRDASTKDGLQRWCKACVAAYQRRHDNVGGPWRAEQRARLLAEQGNKCAVPGCPAGDEALDIEHDHRLAKSNVLSIRGLACRSHNWRLGAAGDQTVPLLDRAVRQIETGQDALPTLRMAQYTARHDARLVDELLAEAA